MDECCWAKCSTGCEFPGKKTEKCGVDGCDVQIHHVCQTRWETIQHKKDHPNAPEGSSHYECANKRCMTHHPFYSSVVNVGMVPTVPLRGKTLHRPSDAGGKSFPTNEGGSDSSISSGASDAEPGVSGPPAAGGKSFPRNSNGASDTESRGRTARGGKTLPLRGSRGKTLPGKQFYGGKNCSIPSDPEDSSLQKEMFLSTHMATLCLLSPVDISGRVTASEMEADPSWRDSQKIDVSSDTNFREVDEVRMTCLDKSQNLIEQIHDDSFNPAEHLLEIHVFKYQDGTQGGLVAATKDVISTAIQRLGGIVPDNATRYTLMTKFLCLFNNKILRLAGSDDVLGMKRFIAELREKNDDAQCDWNVVLDHEEKYTTLSSDPVFYRRFLTRYSRSLLGIQLMPTVGLHRTAACVEVYNGEGPKMCDRVSDYEVTVQLSIPTQEEIDDPDFLIRVRKHSAEAQMRACRSVSPSGPKQALFNMFRELDECFSDDDNERTTLIPPLESIEFLQQYDKEGYPNKDTMVTYFNTKGLRWCSKPERKAVLEDLLANYNQGNRRKYNKLKDFICESWGMEFLSRFAPLYKQILPEFGLPYDDVPPEYTKYGRIVTQTGDDDVGKKLYEALRYSRYPTIFFFFQRMGFSLRNMLSRGTGFSSEGRFREHVQKGLYATDLQVIQISILLYTMKKTKRDIARRYLFAKVVPDVSPVGKSTSRSFHHFLTASFTVIIAPIHFVMYKFEKANSGADNDRKMHCLTMLNLFHFICTDCWKTLSSIGENPDKDKISWAKFARTDFQFVMEENEGDSTARNKKFMQQAIEKQFRPIPPTLQSPVAFGSDDSLDQLTSYPLTFSVLFWIHLIREELELKNNVRLDDVEGLRLAEQVYSMDENSQLPEQLNTYKLRAEKFQDLLISNPGIVEARVSAFVSGYSQWRVLQEYNCLVNSYVDHKEQDYPVKLFDGIKELSKEVSQLISFFHHLKPKGILNEFSTEEESLIQDLYKYTENVEKIQPFGNPNEIIPVRFLSSSRDIIVGGCNFSDCPSPRGDEQPLIQCKNFTTCKGVGHTACFDRTKQKWRINSTELLCSDCFDEKLKGTCCNFRARPLFQTSKDIYGECNGVGGVRSQLGSGFRKCATCEGNMHHSCGHDIHDDNIFKSGSLQPFTELLVEGTYMCSFCVYVFSESNSTLDHTLETLGYKPSCSM